METLKLHLKLIIVRNHRKTLLVIVSSNGRCSILPDANTIHGIGADIKLIPDDVCTISEPLCTLWCNQQAAQHHADVRSLPLSGMGENHKR